jgi:hypothetical protein
VFGLRSAHNRQSDKGHNVYKNLLPSRAELEGRTPWNTQLTISGLWSARIIDFVQRHYRVKFMSQRVSNSTSYLLPFVSALLSPAVKENWHLGHLGNREKFT